MSSIREDARKAPEMVFEIIPEWAGQVATDVRKGWGGKDSGVKVSFL
jgi:hypothetical protein